MNKKIVIEREFSAPLAHVWNGWTDESVLKEWYAPPGMSCAYAKMDFREGGVFLYSFKGEDGQQFWGRILFKKIDEPTLLVFDDTFSDDKGTPVPPSHYGIPGEEILESLVEVAFSENDGKTKITMNMDNHYGEDMEEMMVKGWEGMLDKLNGELSKM